MRAAVIDIGSNSIKLVIGEDDGQSLKILETLKNVVGIGRNTFYKGRIAQRDFKKVIDVLNSYKKVTEDYKVERVKVVATTAVREASNRDIFLDTVTRQTGFDLDVLKVGDVVYYIDAFLTYRFKKKYPIHEKSLIIAELGAGSLDISFLEKGATLMTVGIPIGTHRLRQFKNLINSTQQETYEAIEEYVDNEMRHVKSMFLNHKVDDLILVDESYSQALHRVLPNEKREDNFFQLQQYEADDFNDLITVGNLDDVAYKYKISNSIADSIDGYGVILKKLFRLTPKKSIRLLEASLSEAMLTNLIFSKDMSRTYNKDRQLIYAARFLAKKFGGDLQHLNQVARLSQNLFKQLKDLLGLEKEHLLYLKLASYLHDVGMYINNRAHHKHSEYIISSFNLFRLTDAEIKIIACVSRYHRKAQPRKSHLLYQSLSFDEKIVVQKLGAILRMSNALEASHRRKLKSVSIEKKPGELVFHADVSGSFTLEEFVFQERKTMFEDISGYKVKLITKSV